MTLTLTTTLILILSLTLIQDYAKLLGGAHKTGFTTFERWIGYTPCKNNSGKAAELAEKKMSPMSAGSCEMDYYAANCRLLEEAGMSVEAGEVRHFNKIPLEMGPRVVLGPFFMPSVYKVAERVKGGSISARSTLIIEGDVTIENLVLDGALVIKAAPGGRITIKDLTVRNTGWEVLALDGVNLPEPVHEESGWLDRIKTQEVINPGVREIIVF